jgi:hypothetical protein
MNQDPNFDGHEQRGNDSALTQAGLILLGMVLTAVIVVTVLVDNSDASWETKAGCVSVALTGLVILLRWID